MQSPVPLSKLTPERLGCGLPGGAPGKAGATLRQSGPEQQEPEQAAEPPASPPREQQEQDPQEQPADAADAPAPAPVPAPASDSCSYSVQPGDGLEAIAERAGLSLDELLALNPQKAGNPDSLEDGEALRLCPSESS